MAEHNATSENSAATMVEILAKLPACGDVATTRVELYDARVGLAHGALDATWAVCTAHVDALRTSCAPLTAYVTPQPPAEAARCGDGFDFTTRRSIRVERTASATVEREHVSTAADAVTAQIRAWVEAGLPDGGISLAPHDDRLMWLQVQDPNALAIWAVAIGERIMTGALILAVGPVRLDTLGGWRFQVWCDAPTVPAELRIPVEPVQDQDFLPDPEPRWILCAHAADNSGRTQHWMTANETCTAAAAAMESTSTTLLGVSA